MAISGLKPILDTGSFRRGQWRILLLVMFCYLFFYTGRQNFGFAARGMQDELHLSSTAIGLFNAMLLLGYGVGQAINGNLADMYGARRMVAIGAFASVALNWCVSLSQSFVVAVAAWGVNGLAQSTAWPAMNRALANWWPKHERGKAIGMYLLAAGFSSSLTFMLCILVIGNLDWRWVFRLPVSLLLIGGAVFFLFARDRPEDMGFAALPADTVDEPPPPSGETSFQRYAAVLRNRPFQLACLSIGCESVARYGLLSWVPIHFLGPDWRNNTAGLWVTMALPLGMAAGALTAGLAADRWFPNRRARVVLYYLGAAAVTSFLLAVVPTSNTMAGMILLAVTGFLVYGPQASYWALCPGLVGRERAGTATGLMDSVAYGFAALGQVVIGRAIDVSHTTTSAFVVIAIACLIGAVIILPVKK
ncbi:MAG: MFS transporter [Candidatus Solibacter sp.]|nr:MFS transporter [Candidatus Solibacter sp.]